jgi:hypothetical protein
VTNDDIVVRTSCNPRINGSSVLTDCHVHGRVINTVLNPCGSTPVTRTVRIVCVASRMTWTTATTTTMTTRSTKEAATSTYTRTTASATSATSTSTRTRATATAAIITNIVTSTRATAMDRSP